MVKAAFLVEKAEVYAMGNVEVGSSFQTRSGSVMANRCLAEYRCRTGCFGLARAQCLVECSPGNFDEDCDMAVLVGIAPRAVQDAVALSSWLLVSASQTMLRGGCKGQSGGCDLEGEGWPIALG